MTEDKLSPGSQRTDFAFCSSLDTTLRPTQNAVEQSLKTALLLGKHVVVSDTQCLDLPTLRQLLRDEQWQQYLVSQTGHGSSPLAVVTRDMPGFWDILESVLDVRRARDEPMYFSSLKPRNPAQPDPNDRLGQLHEQGHLTVDDFLTQAPNGYGQDIDLLDQLFVNPRCPATRMRWGLLRANYHQLVKRRLQAHLKVRYQREEHNRAISELLEEIGQREAANKTIDRTRMYRATDLQIARGLISRQFAAGIRRTAIDFPYFHNIARSNGFALVTHKDSSGWHYRTAVPAYKREIRALSRIGEWLIPPREVTEADVAIYLDHLGVSCLFEHVRKPDFLQSLTAIDASKDEGSLWTAVVNHISLLAKRAKECYMHSGQRQLVDRDIKPVAVGILAPAAATAWRVLARHFLLDDTAANWTSPGVAVVSGFLFRKFVPSVYFGEAPALKQVREYLAETAYEAYET